MSKPPASPTTVAVRNATPKSAVKNTSARKQTASKTAANKLVAKKTGAKKTGSGIASSATKQVTLKNTVAAPAKNAIVRKVSAKKLVTKNTPAVKKNANHAVPTESLKQPTLKQPAASPSGGKLKKPKLIRDSFTMPESEYQVLADIKKAFLKAGIAVKKSELLRAGVALLRASSQDSLRVVIAGLPALKAGRPKKGK